MFSSAKKTGKREWFKFSENRFRRVIKIRRLAKKTNLIQFHFLQQLYYPTQTAKPVL